MRKYTFAQGKVWVEDGIYRPVLKDKSRSLDSGVLILLPPSIKKPEPSALDKEKKPTS